MTLKTMWAYIGHHILLDANGYRLQFNLIKMLYAYIFYVKVRRCIILPVVPVFKKTSVP